MSVKYTVSHENVKIKVRISQFFLMKDLAVYKKSCSGYDCSYVDRSGISLCCQMFDFHAACNVSFHSMYFLRDAIVFCYLVAFFLKFTVSVVPVVRILWAVLSS